MNTPIDVARIIASQRQSELLHAAEVRRLQIVAREDEPYDENSWLARLVHRLRQGPGHLHTHAAA